MTLTTKNAILYESLEEACQTTLCMGVADTLENRPKYAMPTCHSLPGSDSDLAAQPRYCLGGVMAFLHRKGGCTHRTRESTTVARLEKFRSIDRCS